MCWTNSRPCADLTKAPSTFLFKLFSSSPSHLLLVFSQISFVIAACNPFVARVENFFIFALGFSFGQQFVSKSGTVAIHTRTDNP
jgi:hypothetical protein